MKKLAFINMVIFVILLLGVTVSCTKDDDELEVNQKATKSQQSTQQQVPDYGMDLWNDDADDNLKCGRGHPAAKAVKAALMQYEITANAGDFDGWISLWAVDGIRMAPGEEPIVGKDAIAIAMQPGFEVFDFEIEIYEVNEVKVYGYIGLTRCRYYLYATPKGGGDQFVIEPDGKALTIFRRNRRGQWKIIYDCFNSNLPPV